MWSYAGRPSEVWFCASRLRPESWLGLARGPAPVTRTCLVRGDGQLVAGLALADAVLGVHADAVGGGRVDVNDGGRVELRGDIFGFLSRIPGVFWVLFFKKEEIET